MSHQCVYVIGECERCGAQVAAELERFVRSMRGRWMVVDQFSVAMRYRRLSDARARVASGHAVGIRAHVRRWRRKDVVYVGGSAFEIADDRLRP